MSSSEMPLQRATNCLLLLQLLLLKLLLLQLLLLFLDFLLEFDSERRSVLRLHVRRRCAPIALLQQRLLLLRLPSNKQH